MDAETDYERDRIPDRIENTQQQRKHRHPEDRHDPPLPATGPAPTPAIGLGRKPVIASLIGPHAAAWREVSARSIEGRPENATSPDAATPSATAVPAGPGA